MSVPDSTSRPQLISFAELLRGLPNSTHPAFSSRVLAEGLMIPRGFTAKFLGVLVKVIRWRRKLDTYSAYALVLSNPNSNGVATDTFHQTIDWMLNGRDASSSKSSGGFNQDELNKLHLIYSSCLTK